MEVIFQFGPVLKDTTFVTLELFKCRTDVWKMGHPDTRKGSVAWGSAQQGKHQSNLRLCYTRWVRPEAKQAYLFSPVYKPKDQPSNRTHRLSWHLGCIQIDLPYSQVYWLCLSSVSKWVTSVLLKNIQYRGWRGGSAIKRTITFLEDLGSIPNLHVMAHNHL